MLAKERLACLGFPVYKKLAKVAGCPQLIYNESSATLKAMAGNSWYLPNAGLVPHTPTLR